MNKLALLFAALLLISFVGCSTADNPVAPDTSEQVQTNDTAQKPPTPGDPTDTMHGPSTPGDPSDLDGGPH